MEKATTENKITIRGTDGMIRRAERLRVRAANAPMASGRITTSAILDRAMELRLGALEHEYN